MQAMISGARFELNPFTPALLRYSEVVMGAGAFGSRRRRRHDATSRGELRHVDFAPSAVTRMLATGYKHATI
jgi:hypothetical protein